MAEAIGTFLDTLYKQQEGYVYAPTLDRELSKEEGWTTKFYKWPEQRQSLIEHAQNNTKKLEIYLGPALYKSNTLPVKDNIKGSNVVWAEFDGIAPQYNESIPNPSMWLDSSKEENHTHVYWALESFCTDAEQIENINRALTYNLGADSGGWDSTQVLRMPLTINHKRKQFTSEVNYNKAYDLLSTGAFAEIKPPVDDVNATFDRTKIPADINQVAWAKLLSENGYRLFIKKVTDLDDRSNSLMALAFFMAEQKNGLTNEEMYGVLYNADERWGKFRDRKDREKRLIDIVIKARQKYPLSGIVTDDNVSFESYDEMMADIGPVEWAVNDLLERRGVMLYTGPPGSGKTQMSLMFAHHMACGKKFIGFDFPKKHKTMFLSLEMGKPDLQVFMSRMAKAFEDDPQDMVDIRNNLVINTRGYGIGLDTPEGQKIIEDEVKLHEPDGIFIDSLFMSTMQDLASQLVAAKLTDFFKRLAATYDMFVWVIHHNRKQQIGNAKPVKQSDVYGSQFLMGGVSAGITIWPTSQGVEVYSIKTRLVKQFTKFVVIRDPETLNFTLPTIDGLLAEESSSEEEVDGDNEGSKEFTVGLG